MKTFSTFREFSGTPEEIFKAFVPAQLERWWGPAGFTNTFEVCEVKTAGRWLLTMHAPDGTDYPNEYLFKEVRFGQEVTIQHLGEPKFTLSIGLNPSPNGTQLSWVQTFENEDIANRIEHIVVPANEQNLDRLTEVLKSFR